MVKLYGAAKKAHDAKVKLNVARNLVALRNKDGSIDPDTSRIAVLYIEQALEINPTLRGSK